MLHSAGADVMGVQQQTYRIHPTMVQHNNAVSTLLSHIDALVSLRLFVSLWPGRHLDPISLMLKECYGCKCGHNLHLTFMDVLPIGLHVVFVL